MENEPQNPLDPIVAESQNLTIDRVLRASPSTIRNDQDLRDLVVALRGDRARFIAMERSKEDRKEGVETGRVDLDAPETPEEAAG